MHKKSMYLQRFEANREVDQHFMEEGAAQFQREKCFYIFLDSVHHGQVLPVLLLNLIAHPCT
jgi:hypothetical protein